MVSFFILCPIINLIHTSFAPALSISEARSVCMTVSRVSGAELCGAESITLSGGKGRNLIRLFWNFSEGKSYYLNDLYFHFTDLIISHSHH